MRVALTQMDIAWEDKDSNRSKCVEMVREAAAEKADILLFPEMTLTGFSMNVPAIADRERETVQFFSGLAREYGIAVGFGYVTSEAEKGRNHFCVVDREGETLEDYVKTHPFTYGGESDVYEGGSRICHFSLNGFLCGMSICYDLRFPECFQKLPMDTDAVFVIANWPESRIDHWYTLLKARAIELQTYLVGINRTGVGNGIRYVESSVAYDAAGQQVPFELPLQGGLKNLYVDLDREARLDYVKRFPTRCDQRMCL